MHSLPFVLLLRDDLVPHTFEIPHNGLPEPSSGLRVRVAEYTFYKIVYADPHASSPVDASPHLLHFFFFFFGLRLGYFLYTALLTRRSSMKRLLTSRKPCA